MGGLILFLCAILVLSLRKIRNNSSYDKKYLQKKNGFHFYRGHPFQRVCLRLFHSQPPTHRQGAVGVEIHVGQHVERVVRLAVEAEEVGADGPGLGHVGDVAVLRVQGGRQALSQPVREGVLVASRRQRLHRRPCGVVVQQDKRYRKDANPYRLRYAVKHIPVVSVHAR